MIFSQYVYCHSRRRLFTACPPDMRTCQFARCLSARVVQVGAMFLQLVYLTTAVALGSISHEAF